MKNFIFTFIFIFVFPIVSFANVSEGYRMGRLVETRETGWFVKSRESLLMMGIDGQPMKVETKSTDSKGKTTYRTNIINPWKFTSKLNGIGTFIGDYVWVEYTKSYFRNVLIEDTPYDVTAISKINDKFSGELSSVEAKNYRPAKAEGALICRLVQTSKTGVAVKTYEATVQVGGTGGDYRFMTIEDEDIYKFSIDALKSGALVKVIYEKLGIGSIGSFSNTDYRITKIEILK